MVRKESYVVPNGLRRCPQVAQARVLVGDGWCMVIGDNAMQQKVLESTRRGISVEAFIALRRESRGR